MNEEQYLNWKNKFFKKSGYDMLYNYTRNLIKEWYKKKDNQYPFTLGIVMGIPNFQHTAAERTFENKSELEGRIKGYMQLLGILNIEVKIGINKFIFSLDNGN